jgi:hypothetical protein
MLYDYETCSFIRDVSLVGLDSYDQKMRRNDDGSVDDYLHINVACFGRIDRGVSSRQRCLVRGRDE